VAGHGAIPSATRQTAAMMINFTMKMVRRTLEIDADTDTRLREMAAERGQDVPPYWLKPSRCSIRLSTSPARHRRGRRRYDECRSDRLACSA